MIYFAFILYFDSGWTGEQWSILNIEETLVVTKTSLAYLPNGLPFRKINLLVPYNLRQVSHYVNLAY
jgi:hypothetical protein